MCTYEDLVAATLPYGLSPLVVPQLKTITLGGAVTGLGIESASFRNGLPHESVLEMDILTGTGDVRHRVGRSARRSVSARSRIPMGRLGYSVRLKIELEPVKPFVALRHLRFHSLTTWSQRWTASSRPAATTAPRSTTSTAWCSAPTRATWRSASRPAPRARSATTPASDIYYRSIQHADGEKHDRLTIHDYLWRWDTDWFWCSRAFGAQNPRIRRFWPRRYRRSSFYWKLIGYDQRFNIADRIEKRNGRPPRERVVQDIEVPIGRTAEFLRLVPGQRPDRTDLACARCGFATTA